MSRDRGELYEGKEPGYFTAAREDLLALLPETHRGRLLDLGAGRGTTLRWARAQGLATHTVGIDLVAPDDREGLDHFFVGDLESLLERGDPALAPGSFDAALCADVLEHLVDPWSTVEALSALLRPGGVLLASLPNIRNHRALRPILAGDFRYEDAGLLDRTHLRFFCRANARALFEGAGLTVDRVDENMGGYGVRHRLLDRLTFGRFHDFFVFQYLIRAVKP